MMKSKSNFFRIIQNTKGQVAFFVAMAFPIVFLFFAMVINVGLLVHHKINLQNSVDLAAYYGAMKQAEGMNAIAHMNYQIRQSWKLLAWRYRMLGSAGEWGDDPNNPNDKGAHPYIKTWNPKPKFNPNLLADFIATTPTTTHDWQTAPAFCITYHPFKEVPPSESTCKYAAKNSLHLWQTPPIIAGFLGTSHSLQRASIAALNQAVRQCEWMGSWNYIMLGKFVLSYKYDQADRMSAISDVAKALSYAGDNFYDIDGELVKEGIEKTFKYNLTAPNLSSIVEFKIYNSLGHEKCNASGGAKRPKWLVPMWVSPGFKYVDTDCNTSALNYKPKDFLGIDSIGSLPKHRDQTPLKKDVYTIADLYGDSADIENNISVGVEKNPWCMAYVGVSATTEPKIPFAPLGGVKLHARAFYKPFGGRMGPWYSKSWKQSDDASGFGIDDRVDDNIPPRYNDPAKIAAIANSPANFELRAANFSRYVGDTIGLKGFQSLAYYGQAIYNTEENWRNMGPNASTTIYHGSKDPNYAVWDHLFDDFRDKNGNGDILAWNHVTNSPSLMRALEVSGILPDAFDIAYFSIEPDFYHNYYQRMKNGFFNKVPGVNTSVLFRPDIGYHKGFKSGNYDYEAFSVKDQYSIVSDPNHPLNFMDTVTEKFKYTSLKWENLLTGWAPVSLSDYSLDQKKFGKCDAPPEGAANNDPKPPTAGNCVTGGTTGYSVKMVSSDYLNDPSLNLGGEKNGVPETGAIKNPPPTDF